MRTKKRAIDSKEKALLVLNLLEDKKAERPVALDLRKLTLVCDFFVICSGTSSTHIRGLADHLITELKKEKVGSSRIEGYQQCEWVLVDCGDVVVHIFAPEQRDFYGLERLWGDAPQIENPQGD